MGVWVAEGCYPTETLQRVGLILSNAVPIPRWPRVPSILEIENLYFCDAGSDPPSSDFARC